MFRHLRLILKNCWRNRRRTLLTVFSISISLCLLGLMLSIYHAFYQSEASPAQARRLITRNRVSLLFPMPQSYRERIKQVPGVVEVGISQWFGGTYLDNRPEHMFARFAVQPEKIFVLREGDMVLPEDQKKAFLADRTGCIVGNRTAEKQNFHIGQKITLQGDIFPMNAELTIRGIFTADENNDLLYFSREYLEESLNVARRGNAGTFNILAASPADVPRIEAAVDEMFHNAPVQTKTESESAFSLSFVSFLGNVKAFLLSVVAAVTFTILLVCANTIAMSVRERVREVGILKTLGFNRGAILGIILGEAVAISLIGGIIGVGLAAVLTQGVRNAPGMMLDQLQRLSLPPSVAGECLIVAVLVGLLSALVPAYNASRISILEALRTTD